MLPEAGAFELAFLAIVALIVVGPKDLPVLLRKLGQFTAKMRGLASEFRSSFDEMARQSELDDLRREVEALRDGRFGDAHKPEIKGHIDEINAGLSWKDHTAHEGATPLAPQALPEPVSEAAPTSAAAEVEPELPFPAAEPTRPAVASHAETTH